MRLPFTRDAFFDLLAAYNTSLWPAVIALWVASAVACAWLVSSSDRSHDRWISGLLAVHWAWSAIAYHLTFFTRINPAASLFAVLFLVQAALFVWFGLIRGDLSFKPSRTTWTLTGGFLMLYALLYPAIAVVWHGSIVRAPTFALPCPTTIFTAGVLLRTASPQRSLTIVPIAWSVIGGSAAFLLGVSADYALPVAGAALALFALHKPNVSDGWLRVGQTKPFRGPDRKVLLNSVAEAGYLRLGGVEQWVMIRGENVANPALIVLHGGPGMSEMGFFRRWNAPLEQHFTVVHWDQRGTGKSFDRDIPRSSMTLEQFVADLDELVDIVRRRFRMEKVAILGHSWGSALGAIYAARFPKKVSVYVGAAQIGDWPAAESLSYAFGLAEAERQQDEKAMKKLRTIGPPPYPSASVFVERTVVSRLAGQTRPGVLWKAGRALFARPESSIFDLAKLVRGFAFTLDAMWPEVSKLNLLKLVPALQVPVLIFAGRNDHWVPPETSVAYFNALAAPAKQLVWFENSGHEAFVDEPEKFNLVMINMVRPLALPAAESSAAQLPVSA